MFGSAIDRFSMRSWHWQGNPLRCQYGIRLGQVWLKGFMTSLYISADYVSALLEYAEKKGLALDKVLNADTMPTVLTGLVPWPVMAAVIHASIGQQDEALAGLEFGLTLGITHHGLLGYAARSAHTPLEALLLDEKYLATRTNAMRFRVMGDKDNITLHLESALTPEMIGWRFLHLATLGSMARMCKDLFHRQILTATFTLPFAVDFLVSYHDELLAGIHWRTEPKVFSMTVAASMLSAILPTGDATLKQLLIGQCEAAMPAANTLNDTVAMVRHLLLHQLVEPPHVSQLGRQLNLSERTLKRHLQQAGTSYREILRDLRVQAATHYLQTTDWSIDKIASRLGYDSPSTFKNLFRRWTGKTLGEVRASNKI
jgi:AraC-like DNA-binding protein